MSAVTHDEPVAAAAALPCIYCRASIPAAAFEFWSPARRLLSAQCPACSRTMTLAAQTWHRWRAADDLSAQVEPCAGVASPGPAA